MTRPEKTSGRDPLLHVAGALGDPSRYIEEMEAAGGAAMAAANSDVIPTEILSGGESDLTGLGFTLGEMVADDPLFRRATLPEGWRRESTGHPMGTNIVDPLSRSRVSIFYKAAFYDRRAYLSVISVSGYAYNLIHSDHDPVLDDTWATSAAMRDALSKLRDRYADELREFGDDNRFVDDLNKNIARCDALIAAVDAAAGGAR